MVRSLRSDESTSSSNPPAPPLTRILRNNQTAASTSSATAPANPNNSNHDAPPPPSSTAVSRRNTFSNQNPASPAPPVRSSVPTPAPEVNIKFKVIATEDLHLDGAERSILRVKNGNSYSCVMTSTQKFSSLFRHYSKYHGLDKEKLDFTFTNKLVMSDTPESVFLQSADEVFVSIKKEADFPLSMNGLTKSFITDMEAFTVNMSENDCRDLYFRIPGSSEDLGAIMAILACRCPLFAPYLAHLSCTKSDTKKSNVIIDSHFDLEVRENETPTGSSRAMLVFSLKNEFVLENTLVVFKALMGYIMFDSDLLLSISTGNLCDRVETNAAPSSTDAYLELMRWSKRLGLPGLFSICERGAAKMLSEDNVGKLLCGLASTDGGKAEALCTIPESSDAAAIPSKSENLNIAGVCVTYILENIKTLTENEKFKEQMTMIELIIPVMKGAASTSRKRKAAST